MLLQSRVYLSSLLQEARRVDATLQNAWLGHPHCSIIDNSTSFAGKLQRMTEWVKYVVFFSLFCSVILTTEGHLVLVILVNI